MKKRVLGQFSRSVFRPWKPCSMPKGMGIAAKQSPPNKGRLSLALKNLRRGACEPCLVRTVLGEHCFSQFVYARGTMRAVELRPRRGTIELPPPASGPTCSRSFPNNSAWSLP